jgi:hypothetical protein
VEFIELPTFVRLAQGILTDEDIRALQNFLLEQPDKGNVIAGVGGIRKLRWGFGKRGKRSGVRIIYYHVPRIQTIYLPTMYSKNEKTDLAVAEKRALLEIIKVIR